MALRVWWVHLGDIDKPRELSLMFIRSGLHHFESLWYCLPDRSTSYSGTRTTWSCELVTRKTPFDRAISDGCFTLGLTSMERGTVTIAIERTVFSTDTSWNLPHRDWSQLDRDIRRSP